ncbi:gamma-glutamyltransferase [bacterium]|nr:gamma-glutamyltransferase [bacterium]
MKAVHIRIDWLIGIILLVFICDPAMSRADDIYENEGVQKVCSEKGVVVSASRYATKAGIRILERGGNAVDAAVTVGFVLSVTYPTAGNIGGGGFMLIRTAEGKNSFVDFREKAPMAADRDMYLDSNGEIIKDLSRVGHRASGVPGTVAGLYLAHKIHGSLPWKELVDPAVILAQEGFTIDMEMAKSFYGLRKLRENFPGLKKFARDDGKPLRPGYRLFQPDLASTLRRIANNGPNGFYTGKTAELISEEMKRGGGLITKEDLNRYQALIRNPIEGDYRGYHIISAPPPSSGGTTLIEIMNMLEGYPLGSNEFMSVNVVQTVIECERRAYLDRSTYLGDPDFVDIPLSRLTSKKYAEKLRSGITTKASSSKKMYKNRVRSEKEETTHYSIIDSEGNSVSTTTTLNGSYGSKVVVKGAGFLLNNEMDDFSVKPGVPNMYGLLGGSANAIEPGKRMLSSMAPTIVTHDDKVYLILGTPGGATIITSVVQIILDIIDFGLSPVEAVSTPRYHHQCLPDIVYHEFDAFTQRLKSELEEKGYNLKERSFIGDVQLIMVKGSFACGVSDPRMEGLASAVKEISIKQ